MNEKIIIYTDGASSGNPGPGGWGAVVSNDGKVRELGGGDPKTTNNRMEMMAAAEALCEVAPGESATVYTDSQYLINGITKWVFGWVKNNWQTQSKQEVLNKDLWQQLLDATGNKKIEWVAVRGHAGSKLNNRVDEIAVAFSKGESPHLFYGNAADYFTKVAAPSAEEMAVSSGNDRKKQKAFSYLSMLDGMILKHATWVECEARVKGQPGAKFRKSISAEDEAAIITEWQKDL